MAGVAFTMGACRRCDKQRVPMRSVCGICVTCTAEVRALGHRKFYPKVWRVEQVMRLSAGERTKLWGTLRKQLIGVLGRATLAEWLGLDLHKVADDEQTPPTIAGAIRVIGYIAFVEARRDGGDSYFISAEHAITYVSEAHAEHAAILAIEQAPTHVSTPPRTRKGRTSDRSLP